MLLSRKHGFIFVKTRKTAGSTFEHLMFPHLGKNDVCTGSKTDGTPSLNEKTGRGHLSWTEIRARYPEEWASFYRFTIERNPWDKVVDSYFWYRKARPQEVGVRAGNFHEYVNWSKILPADWVLYADDQAPVVDKIFRFEEMDRMYEEMKRRFGIDIPLDKIRSTRLKASGREDRHYSDMYDEETNAIVQRRFAHEISHFDYRFERVPSEGKGA